MSKIEELIEEFCPEGVKFLPLSEVAKVTIGEFVHKNKQNPDGLYPVYNGGRAETGFYDHYNNSGNKIVISARGAYAGFVNRVLKPYWAGNSSYSVTVQDTAQADWNYIYYYLKKSESKFTESQQKGGIPAVSKKQVESFKVPIPPLEVQKEIVNILDKFTELEAELSAELSAELDARRKQYEYYRKQLLTFDESVVPFSDLGDVYKFQYGKGNTIPTAGGDYPVYGSNGVVGSHHEYNSEDAPVIGHIGAYAGIVNWGEGKHFVTYNGVICQIKSGIDDRFGYHLLMKQNLRELARDGSQPFVSYDKLNSVKVQIPDIDTQKQIAKILDGFDLLTNGITEGLPAEINARRQQYEYYRTKLLTFEELPA